MNKQISLWLFIVAAVTALTIIIGALTRLTDSGLSITEWQAVSGVVPPLTAQDWQTAFEKYKQIPEYQLINRGMELAAFKTIYWWEWAHRLLGRVVGVVFLVPFLVFAWRGQVSPRAAVPLLGLFALGAAQGGLGWYMVQSGLAQGVDVSHFRLAAHLGLALIIFALSLWLALGYWHGRAFTRFSHAASAIIALVLVQSVLGALVAGLDAGTIYNDFPLMDGALVPDLRGTDLRDPLLVQFLHRLGGYALLGLVLFHALSKTGGKWLLSAVFLQMALGVITLLYGAPLWLAAAHQMGALLVLVLAVARLYRLSHLIAK